MNSAGNFLRTAREYYRRKNQIRRFTANLKLLNDTLGETGFGNRFWVQGGMLLGWARDRKFLINDYHDADFGFMSGDSNHLLAAVDTLRSAGFERCCRFLNNNGDVTQYVFKRDGIKFDFFEVRPVGNLFRLHGYGLYHDQWLQLVCEFSSHGLNTFNYLGRDWLKPDDHERFLDESYGDWRTPNPDFWFLEDDRSIVERVPWTRQHEMNWND